MANMALGQSIVAAPDRVVVEFKKGLANATVRLLHMVANSVLVHRRRQEIAAPRDAQVCFVIY